MPPVIIREGIGIKFEDFSGSLPDVQMREGLPLVERVVMTWNDGSEAMGYVVGKYDRSGPKNPLIIWGNELRDNKVFVVGGGMAVIYGVEAEKLRRYKTIPNS